MAEQLTPKPLFWVGSSRADLRSFPKEVLVRMGYALYVAQEGGKHRDAKPLKGFGAADVLEVVTDHRGDTFRGIYTVRFRNAVYVLHAFQKKAKKAAATPKSEVNLIKRRLQNAALHAAEQELS